jgi:hypothetical protein
MDADTVTGFLTIVVIVLGAYYIGYIRGQKESRNGNG